MRARKRLLMVSLDAVSDSDVDRLLQMKGFSGLCEKGTLVREVQSVFLTNTYPVHTSIMTGCHPFHHGILDNTLFQPYRDRPDWHWYARDIKVPTLFTKANEAGLRSASVMWPVAGRAKVDWNVPEILPLRPHQNQLEVSLTAGSPLLQLRLLAKYGKGLLSEADSQPALDRFSCTAMCDIILRKKPDFMALHLTDCDTQKHIHGIDATQTMQALERLDGHVFRLMDCLEKAGMREECSVIVLGDHAALPVLQSVNPNEWLAEEGLQKRDSQGQLVSYKAWFRCSGGTAFLYSADGAAVEAARQCAQNKMGKELRRFLSVQEMMLSGMDEECVFGVEASDGTELTDSGTHHKATHGYTLRNANYQTFYFAQGEGIPAGKRIRGGSLLEIAPIAARLLGLSPWSMDGKIREGVFQ